MLTRIGITLGDAAGIGPEIVRAALDSKRLPASAEYRLIGKYPECTPGKPSPETARAAAAALEEAVTLTRRGELDAVVTAPIHKARMYEVGFKFPGQTEFFAERCGVKNFAMLLTGKDNDGRARDRSHSVERSFSRAETIGDRSSRSFAGRFSSRSIY